MGQPKIAIIGSGVSGLIAGINLKQADFQFDIFESTDRVGGRVKTDYREGYQFDHGFQVMLTAYPATQKYLDYELLSLQNFKPGAVIYKGGKSQKIGDPLRDLSLLIPTTLSTIGSFGDKLKILKLRSQLKSKSFDEIFKAPEQTSLSYLQNFGFSEAIINDFFKPFFTGIFLETELSTSSRKFEFVYKMFTEGYASVPKKGIQAISNQLAAKLDKSCFHFNKKAANVTDGSISFEDGSTLEYDYVIIATDAAQLIKNLNNQSVAWKSVENLYFTTTAKVEKDIICLIADESLVNNFHLEQQNGQSVVSISVVKTHDLDKEELIAAVKSEMLQLCHINLDECIKYFKINKALPQMGSVSYMLPKSETQLKEKIFLAGDHLANGSLNAAMLNGESAAQAVIEKIKHGIINIEQ